MACGTGGMLSTAHDFIVRMNPDANVRLFGQENMEVLLEFLEDTQHDEMERLRRMYKDRTNDTVINYINSEINKETIPLASASTRMSGDSRILHGGTGWKASIFGFGIKIDFSDVCV